MTKTVPFEPGHLRALDVQEAQKAVLGSIEQDGYGEHLHSLGPAGTLMAAGVPVACAGLMMVGEHRAVAWAILARDCAPRMRALHRAVSRFLETCGVRRVETVVLCDFEAGHRWARMLGFKMEAERMEAYDAAGNAYALYARVQDG